MVAVAPAWVIRHSPFLWLIYSIHPPPVGSTNSVQFVYHGTHLYTPRPWGQPFNKKPADDFYRRASSNAFQRLPLNKASPPCIYLINLLGGDVDLHRR